jgi:ubiquitin carboxyl-terminal hydrolase 8
MKLTISLSVTAEMIEDSLSLAPPIELTLFKNRDKFDLVVMYDQRSTTHEPQFKALGHAIYETAFHKMLKRMPVLLIGGLQSWKMVVGEEAVGESSAQDDHARGRRHREHKERRSHGTNGVASVSHASGQPPSSREASIAAQRHRSQTESATNSPRHQSLARSDALRFTPEQASTSSRTSVPPLARKPLSPPTQYASPRPYGETAAPLAQSWSTASSSIQYPSFRPMTPSMPRSGSPSVGTSSFHASGAHSGIVSPPPQASINPSPLVRRRSDFIDQSQEALSHSALGIRAPIDYPELHSHIRAPPPIASPSERQDNRLRPSVLNSPRAPIIQSEYPVGYWRDASIQTSGLKNMGNTCYMNSTIQCLIATVPFAQFFLSRFHITHRGRQANASLLFRRIVAKRCEHAKSDRHQGPACECIRSHLDRYGEAGPDLSCAVQLPSTSYTVNNYDRDLTNIQRSIVAHNSQFEGTEQQDCQEFLSFLLGGLHEDLNRILKKPNYTPTPEREAELERLPVQIASEQEWSIYRMRDDSLIVDLFQGQFRNRLQCMTCHNVSFQTCLRCH